MQSTFEYLLGLPAETALTLLRANGICDTEVVLTSAPVHRETPESRLRDDPEAEKNGYVSTRVVSVRDDGRKLYVARFLVGDPKPKEE